MIGILKPHHRLPVRCKLASCHYETAEKDAYEAIAMNGDLPYGYVLRADVFLQHGNIEDALIDIGIALNMIRYHVRHDYEDAKAYALRGYAHSLPPYGNYDLAYVDYAKAMQILSEEYTVRRVSRPWDSKSPSELRKLVADQTEMMRVKGDRYMTLISRARAFAELGEFRLAYRDLARAVEIEPSQPFAYLVRSALRTDNDDEAPLKADVDQLFRLDPTRPEGFVALARHYHVIGDREAAFVAVDRALTIDAGAWEAYYLRGKLLLDAEDFPGAIDEYRKAVNLPHHDPVCRLQLAELLEGEEVMPEAEAQFKLFVAEADKCDVLTVTDVLLHLDELEEEERYRKSSGHVNQGDAGAEDQPPAKEYDSDEPE